MAPEQFVHVFRIATQEILCPAYFNFECQRGDQTTCMNDGEITDYPHKRMCKLFMKTKM